MLMKPATPFATLRSLDSLMWPNDVLTQSRYNNVPHSHKKPPRFCFPTTALVSFFFISWHFLLRLIVIFRSLLRLPRLTRFPVLVLSAAILVAAHTDVGDLALQLLDLALLLGLGVDLLLAQDT